MDSNSPETSSVRWWDIRVPTANDNIIYGGQHSQYIQTAPLMKRDDSGSSFRSYSSYDTTSTFQSVDSNGSFSSYGTGSSPAPANTTYGGYTLHQGCSPVIFNTTSTNRYSYQIAPPERQSMSKAPLFDIERDGDLNIAWWMYYDFHVDKNGAYHTLQPGYLATERFPAKRFSEKEYDEKGRPVYKCFVPNCKSKPVTRPFDLERHFTSVHGGGSAECYFCDYQKCKHKEAFDRKDHCREHYREYHREDLVKNRQKDAAQWLEDRNVVSSWWRCSKCLKRNQTDRGWECGWDCNHACEKTRVTARESKMEAEESKRKAESQTPVASQLYTQGCGQCESGWFPDEENPHTWVPCLVCRPESL